MPGDNVGPYRFGNGPASVLSGDSARACCSLVAQRTVLLRQCHHKKLVFASRVMCMLVVIIILETYALLP